ncbi:MAG: hypothetical protein AAF497_00270 [Planctomycetota bacterium]
MSDHPDQTSFDAEDDSSQAVAATSPAGIGRKVFGSVIGMAVGFMAMSVLQGISYSMYPMPEGAEPGTEEGMRKFVEFLATLPSSAFLMVLLADAVGAFVCGLACAMIVRNGWRIPVIVCGTLFTLAGVMNLMQFPHPAWFAVIDVLLYVPFAWCGALVASRILPGCQP